MTIWSLGKVNINHNDIELLSNGQPPESEELLQKMTVGREIWLDFFKKYQLDYFIANGGSKVKILVGDQGTGKTHLIRSIMLDAKASGYVTVYLSAKNFRPNNLVDFYQSILKKIDLELIVRGICCTVSHEFSIDDQYDGSEVFIPRIRDQYPNTQIATSEIKKAISKIIKKYDFTPSFQSFVYQVVYNRMIANQQDAIEKAKKWLSATNEITKEEKKEFKALLLFEQIRKFNARDWINSLVQLIRLAGNKGLVISVDDLEVLTEKNPETHRYSYTKNAISDVYEIIRQLIDDTEVLEYCLFIFAGNSDLITNNKRGFRSYDALWIRLQNGFKECDRFNPFSDLLDINKHLKELQSKYLPEITQKTYNLLQEASLRDDYLDFPTNYLENFSQLQQVVIEAAVKAVKEQKKRELEVKVDS